MLLTCDEAWFGGWRGASLLRIERGRLSWAGRADASVGADETGTNKTGADGHLPGTVFAPFTDSHVHLGLVDPVALRAGGIGRVVDLGWDPAVARTWPIAAATDDAWPEVSIAGGLYRAPGGYPSRSGWAPPEAALAIASADDAASAIRAQDPAATVVKITLNSDAGPVWDDDTLLAVVDAAHSAGRPVVAHAQGIGQTRRAARARVDALAHTPFSERLDDDLIADVARSMTWISTLAIHGYGRRGPAFETAVDNLARFVAAGGSVLYGTDLGNGPLPLGLNGVELAGLVEAGLDFDRVVGALTPGSGEPGFDSRVVGWHPGPRPSDVAALADVAEVSILELVRSAE